VTVQRPQGGPFSFIRNSIVLKSSPATKLAPSHPHAMASRKTPTSGGRKRSASDDEPPSGPSELILYTFCQPSNVAHADARSPNAHRSAVDETVWLSQRQMAELFQNSVKTVNEHIGNVYEEGELTPGPTIRNPG
jgi:hypothetical protein